MICDLRSDVLGPLSQEVLDAFQGAASRPPGFGRRDDREEVALCQEAAALFGFEDALFVPTGTLANQIAVRLWTQPGEWLIADQRSHLATNEAASVAGLNDIGMRLLDGPLGHPTAEQLASLVGARNGSAPERRARLVWLENTHNRAGGTVMPAGRLAEILELANRHRLAVHVDGARIWNALVATDGEPRAAFAGASSAMVALNKIAGAPLGALLMGNHAFIEEAARVQKMFGGLCRPLTPLAAAARVALRQWPERARAAHQAAMDFFRRLSEMLAEDDIVDTPQTNIVMLRLINEARVDRVLAALASDAVKVSLYREGLVRCVFHASIRKDMAEAAAEAIAQAVEASRPC